MLYISRLSVCSALEQEDAVLWIDSDIIAAPQDMLPKMIASNLDIITPSCYFYDKSWPRWRQKQWYFDYNVFQGQCCLFCVAASDEICL